MVDKSTDEIRDAVRKNYAGVARGERSSCSCEPTPAASCCGPQTAEIETGSVRLGYSPDELGSVPMGADMGLGCGNPQAIAALRPGEVVLDLGSGGGLDCFLAAQRVGPGGRVIGVDMTPEMISKARENARRGGYANVEFRLGEIEHLPVADNSVDVILSNCVINLSPDKPSVYRDAFRVLKPGGRLAISDVVATAEIPEEIRNDERMMSGCVAGAAHVDELEHMLAETGFTAICVSPKEKSREFIKNWAPGRDIENYVVSAAITAVKPQ